MRRAQEQQRIKAARSPSGCVLEIIHGLNDDSAARQVAIESLQRTFQHHPEHFEAHAKEVIRRLPSSDSMSVFIGVAASSNPKIRSALVEVRNNVHNALLSHREDRNQSEDDYYANLSDYQKTDKELCSRLSFLDECLAAAASRS